MTETVSNAHETDIQQLTVEELQARVAGFVESFPEHKERIDRITSSLPEAIEAIRAAKVEAQESVSDEAILSAEQARITTFMGSMPHHLEQERFRVELGVMYELKIEQYIPENPLSDNTLFATAFNRINGRMIPNPRYQWAKDQIPILMDERKDQIEERIPINFEKYLDESEDDLSLGSEETADTADTDTTIEDKFLQEVKDQLDELEPFTVPLPAPEIGRLALRLRKRHPQEADRYDVQGAARVLRQVQHLVDSTKHNAMYRDVLDSSWYKKTIVPRQQLQRARGKLLTELLNSARAQLTEPKLRTVITKQLAKALKEMDKPSKPKDPIALEVEKELDQIMVKEKDKGKALRVLVRRYHPDLNPGASQEDQEKGKRVGALVHEHNLKKGEEVKKPAIK